MKGFVLLALIASVVVLSFPPLLVTSDVAPAVLTEERGVLVRCTDREQTASCSLYDLTLYETAAQIAADAPPEAIKAQAVCVYTLLQYQLLADGVIIETCLPVPEGYTAVYWQERLGESYNTTMDAYRRSVDAVFGKQIEYEGQPIMALSHAVNGGVTEDGEFLLSEALPYLRAAASPADVLSTSQLTTVSVPLSEANEALSNLLGQTVSIANGVTNVQKTAAGNVVSLKIGEHGFSGVQMRDAFSLPSSAFDVAVQGEQVVFTVHGQGHFVGMSTTGAIAMALDGQSYEQILRHYFSGVTVQ